MVNKERNIQKSADRLVIFEDKKIRRIFHNGEWYFSIVDIVEVLTGSPNPRRYWSNLKMQMTDSEWFIQLYSKTVQLKNEVAVDPATNRPEATSEARLRGVPLRASLMFNKLRP